MSYLVLYTKGARIWMPDPENVWKGAEVTKDYDGKKLCIEYEDGQKQILEITDPEKLPPLRNPEILVGENDLTSLSYLHEPAVLHNLKVRFCDQNAIYTYCGIVLVAINPYEELPIYGNDTIMAYRGQSMGDLDPHIFAVAEEAYTKVERENEDQSIIVSGESGAGKTVSAKYAMRYFATVGGSSTETQVEKKVLASNPIMEAIGNAKTTRNDNSSRFGKYIEIDFDKHFHIIGANMRTYLLEKSRVVFQAPDERNYHIFYQLVASSDLEELKELQLADQSYYHYINQGDSPFIPGVDDAQAFVETRNAFTLLGFPESQQMMMYRIFASILHLGNVTISPGQDTESCFIAERDPHLTMVCQLLGIDYEQMRTWLCFRKIQSMREVIAKPMTPDQAVLTRDALAKHIYSKLFDWIVSHINKSLASSSTVHRFIGVLDIYGFETFEINSFEQFCINYANEKLQQQFNLHVFKLEQEEYVREQIEWKFIDFYDNQPCIDLIESKLGILDLLDEECRMPKGTDDTWCHKLYEKCKKSKHFEKPRLSNSAFIIHHFADKVQYEAAGFLEKNRDTVMEEHINILKASHFELVAELFEEPQDDKKLKPIAQIRSAKPQPMKSQKQHKKTVGSQFRESLGLLMATLNSTTPHYIRCIKPNDQKDSFSFDPKRAVQQLRACGVLETIRISAAGFPSRWSYQDFLQRYRVLTKSKEINRKDIKTTCEKILTNVIKEEDKFQFGKTKIFFRAGQVAYLEKLRSDKLKACVVMMQKHIRGWLYRNRYNKLRNATITFQCHVRGYLARRKAYDLRRNRAAILIQRNVRKFICTRKYLRLRRTAIGIQALARGMWARQKYQRMRENAAATIIQRHVRGWLVRRRCAKKRRQIIMVQCAVRRFLAKKQFKKLKIEARSVERMKKLNKGLENKIISLQQKVEELNKEIKHYKSREEDFKELTAKVEQTRLIENELKVTNNKLQDLEQKLAQITNDYEKSQEENKTLISEKNLLKSEKEEINMQNAQLQENLVHMQELLKANEKEVEDLIKNRLDHEKRLILSEFDAERAAYQKLLKENARLEQRYENLQLEFSRMKGMGPGHNRTPSNISLMSFRSDATELASDFQDEDTGYGSIRAKDKDNHLKLDSITWDQSPASKEPSPGDDEKRYEGEDGQSSPDLMQLQKKVQQLEAENACLKADSQAAKSELQRRESNAQQMMRLQELEQENVKLKNELKKMRESIASTDKAEQTKALLDQFENIQEELERRREECIQLRSILANQSQDLKSITQEAYGGNVDIINEDGELLMAFETQKKLIRQLEMELQAEQLRNNEIRHEMKKLQEDNERQQKLLSQNLKKTPQAQQEAILQHEVNRLTSENVDLKEKVDNLQDQVKKLKLQLKAIYAKQQQKKKKDAPGAPTKQPSVAGTLGMEQFNEVDIKQENGDKPIVKHKQVEYLGMFEYKKEDEPIIIKNLIYDLKPKVAIQMLPGLPAYILFMCVRHTDYINDDEKVQSLLNNTIYGIKRLIKKRHEELDYTVLWLANTCRLLHNLKQYSGDKVFQTENTPKQNEQCLRNFDLSQFRQILSDVAVWIYQAVIKIMEEKVQPLIVPAILEHEAIPGMSGNRPGMRGRSSSIARETEPANDPQKALDILLKELSNFYAVLNSFGVDPELVTQVFRQLYYFVCAGALNNLLLRKDMCHWSKGMQIRYNLSHLEQWCRDQKMQHTEVTESLEPIIQASQLLQARKQDDDAQSVCDMCFRLSNAQIIKILNLYTPIDEFEEKVPVSFIRRIQACLKERDQKRAHIQQPGASSTLLMDTKYAFPIRFPFNPSSIQLEDIVVPEQLNLSGILKKL